MLSSGFVCNIFDFIAKKSTKSGEIIIEQDNFPRVFDDFFWDETENTNSKPHVIKYDLQGYTKEKIVAENGEKQSDYFLKMHLQATLILQCQRCLNAIQFDLNSQNLYKFEICKNQNSSENQNFDYDSDDINNDDFDVIYVNENLQFSENNFQLNSFIEDEIILTLPSFPMHKNCSFENNRNKANKINGNSESDSDTDTDSDSNKPFSNLKNLLNSTKKD